MRPIPRLNPKGPVPAHCDAPSAAPPRGRWRALCCAFHAWALLPTGMGTAGPEPAAGDGPLPSLKDETLQQASAWATAGDAHTRDLFRVAAPGQWVVVRGADVWPMVDDTVLPRHDLLARDGVIRAVQPTGGALPEGALVVPAEGRHVVPGLSENHCHPLLLNSGAMYAPMFGPQVQASDIVLPYDLQMFLFLAGGVTRIQPMLGTAEELALRQAIRSGLMRGPVMRVASPLVDGHPPVWRPAFTLQANDADGGRRAAQLIVERGFDFAKTYTRLGREAYDGLAAECRALGLEITGHIPVAVGVEHALAQGQRGVAHVFELFYNVSDGERRDLRRVERIARLCAEHGVTVQSTLVAAKLLEYDIGQRSLDFSGLLDPLLRELLKPGGLVQTMFQSDPQFVAQGRDCAAQSVQCLQALRAEGVSLVPGTDLPNANVTGPYSIHDEIESYVNEVGMSPLEALRCATLHSARHHRDEQHAGTLEVGKRSELVMLGADPSRDIRATRAVEAVMIGEAVLDRAAIERGVARARSAYAAMPVPQ